VFLFLPIILLSDGNIQKHSGATFITILLFWKLL